MFDKFAPLEFAGSYEQSASTTHVVSIWSIPNSTDYDRAYLTYLFFDSEKDANDFAKKWDAPPEMPMVLTLAQHEAIQRKVAEDRVRRQEQLVEDNLTNYYGPHNFF